MWDVRVRAKIWRVFHESKVLTHDNKLYWSKMSIAEKRCWDGEGIGGLTLMRLTEGIPRDPLFWESEGLH